MPPAKKTPMRSMSDAEKKTASAANKQTTARLKTAAAEQKGKRGAGVAAPKPVDADKMNIAYRMTVTDKSGKKVDQSTMARGADGGPITAHEVAGWQKWHEDRGHNVQIDLVPFAKTKNNSRQGTKPSAPAKKPATPNGVGLSSATARGAKSAPKGTPRRSRARGDAHYVEAAAKKTGSAPKTFGAVAVPKLPSPKRGK